MTRSSQRTTTKSRKINGNSSGDTQKVRSSIPTEISVSQFFELALQDMLWAERTQLKSLPKMIKKAMNENLQSVLKEHLELTAIQVQKIELIFESINKPARTKKCTGMEGILKEADEMMLQFDNNMIDTVIVSAAAKATHYEISAYMMLLAFAKSLHMIKEADLIKSMLAEEKEAARKWQAISKGLIRAIK